MPFDSFRWRHPAPIMNLCDIQTIRTVLHRHGFQFSKSLGQNFLTNAAIPAQIAAQSGAAAVGNVVEIGPGMGCLTAELAQQARRVVTIELDRALFPVLAETLADCPNVTLVQGDVLAIDLPAFCQEHFAAEPVVACANLPYYITTPAITALLDSHAFQQITLMVQKEVAQRICAAAGTASYSAFSIYVQYWAKTELLFDVPAVSFTPRPKVDSAVLRLTPLQEPAVKTSNERLFFSLVRAAFHMRRKTLVNALMPILGTRFPKPEIAALLTDLGLDERIRGERLSLSDFARLTEAVQMAGSVPATETSPAIR